jgi:hypothetical protein
VPEAACRGVLYFRTLSLAKFGPGAPAGISQRYVARMISSSGPAMREAQRKIGKRIVSLLGI